MHVLSPKKVPEKTDDYGTSSPMHRPLEQPREAAAVVRPRLRARSLSE